MWHFDCHLIINEELVACLQRRFMMNIIQKSKPFNMTGFDFTGKSLFNYNNTQINLN